MADLLLFNKPYGVLSQFRTPPGKTSLAAYIDLSNFYPAGRLDEHSEGLLLLTNNGGLQARIAEPGFKLPKTYLAQVEGEISEAAVTMLRRGIKLRDGMTRGARCRVIEPPDLPERDPPIRFRRNKPTSWIALTITEGRNRQVRRMTAAVGYPTLRLYREQVGDWTTRGIAPGAYRQLTVNLPR